MQLLALVAAYGIGSFPSALLVGRWRAGIDVRGHGSGSAGATNVQRQLGWGPALLVLALDVAKGWVAAGPLASWAAGDGSGWLRVSIGFAAVAGHVWPLFARFRGGKGVATGAGALLALEPLVCAGACAVFAVALATVRRVSAASLIAAFAVLPSFWLAGLIRELPPVVEHVAFAGALLVLLVWTHRDNLRRLLAGVEPRFPGAPAGK